MSLRDKLTAGGAGKSLAEVVYGRFGVVSNPFPLSNQTSSNPRLPLPIDDEANSRIATFMRDEKSQVLVIEGTQGVGKTNFLNHFEAEIASVLNELDAQGFYVVRYLADPEASFDGTLRRLFQELGLDHLILLAEAISKNQDAIIGVARSQDMRSALRKLSDAKGDNLKLTAVLMLEWLMGSRILKAHKEALGVQFRLDTVESKTAALRDIVLASSEAKLLKGIFLLLDELEKQAGVLSPTAVVRYLSAMRAIIDALPKHLFMMIAVTPDAMRRYAEMLPAFRSRLQNQLTLSPLYTLDEALSLAKFYTDTGHAEAKKVFQTRAGTEELISVNEIKSTFEELSRTLSKRADTGVKQREFLHQLHLLAEVKLQHNLSMPHIDKV